MTKTKFVPTDKSIVYTIKYRVDIRDDPNLGSILDDMNNVGEAEIVDVEVEDNKEEAPKPA